MLIFTITHLQSGQLNLLGIFLNLRISMLRSRRDTPLLYNGYLTKVCWVQYTLLPQLCCMRVEFCLKDKRFLPCIEICQVAANVRHMSHSIVHAGMFLEKHMKVINTKNVSNPGFQRRATLKEKQPWQPPPPPQQPSNTRGGFRLWLASLARERSFLAWRWRKERWDEISRLLSSNNT